MQKRLLMLFPLLVLAAVIISGCGGGGGGTSSGVQLFLSDAPANVDSIVVSITSVEVHKDTTWQTLKTYPVDAPLKVDLLKYRYNGDTSSTYPLLGETPLDAGHYTMVRLMINAATITVDGVEYLVDITNVTQTGVKFNREFDVAPGQVAALLLDFNAKKSVVKTGSGVYKLQPVTAMVPVAAAAVITGTLAFQDGSSNVVAVPEGTMVDAYAAGDSSTVISSGAVGADGKFSIGPLFVGTYDLKVSAAGSPYDGKVVASGVSVAASETKDVGTVTLVP